MKKWIMGLVLACTLAVVAPPSLSAQCAMCRATVESNHANGHQEARGLNSGILYMLAMPYLLIGVIGFIWWRNRQPEGGPQEVGE